MGMPIFLISSKTHNTRYHFPLLHSFTHSLSHTFTPSHLHSLQSLLQSLLHSFTPSVTPPLLHSFTHSLSHTFTPSLLHSLPQSFLQSLLHSFTHSKGKMSDTVCSSIPDALEALRRGHPVVVMDDMDRENEVCGSNLLFSFLLRRAARSHTHSHTHTSRCSPNRSSFIGLNNLHARARACVFVCWVRATWCWQRSLRRSSS